MGELSLTSIESALPLRYEFGDHYNFAKSMLSKSLGKLHPKIDSLQDQNTHGVYRCKTNKGYFFTIQDPMLPPPEMPTTYANNSEWIKPSSYTHLKLPTTTIVMMTWLTMPIR